MAETSEVILSKPLFCDGETKAQIEIISPSWNQLTSVPAPNPVYFSGPVLLLLPYPVCTGYECQVSSTQEHVLIFTHLFNPFLFISQGRLPVSVKTEMETAVH